MNLLEAKPLEPPDIHFLNGAHGWIGLGNFAEAGLELDRIAPEFQSHPDVLESRWLIHAHGKDWQACLKVAQASTYSAPNRASGWLNASVALHRLQLTEAALDLLAKIAGNFPESWVVPYNLACYTAQLGRFDESRAWIKRAFALGPHSLSKAAINDPDLIPLWESLRRST